MNLQRRLRSVRPARLLAAALVSCCCACYEGWDQPQLPNGSGLPTPPPAPSASTKTFAYILFTPITMAAEAVANDTCFPNAGLRQFRSTEWSLRVDATTTALQALADTVAVEPVTISAADCGKLGLIQAAALNAAPWGINPAASDVTDRRPMVHLRAAFWQGDPQLTPPDQVVATDWAAWQTLKNAGKPVLSRSYFVIANATNGYYTAWRAKIGTAAYLDGAPIDSVDQTDAGIAARQDRVTSDTAALANWLQGQTP